MHMWGGAASVGRDSAKPVLPPPSVLACFNSFAPSVFFYVNKIHTELECLSTNAAKQGRQPCLALHYYLGDSVVGCVFTCRRCADHRADNIYNYAASLSFT